MGCSFDEWHEITESLSKTNKVIMFHRPGLGESEIGNGIRNTETTAKELHELIHLLKLDFPVLLVGHSYGGLCAQHFAKLYPHFVAGIVLVDSTSVDLKELDELDLPVLNEDSDEVWMEKCQLYASMNSEKLRNIIKPVLTKKQKQLPNDLQQRIVDFQVNPSLYGAMYLEIKNWKDDAEIIKGLGFLKNVPLLIIGRDKDFNIRLGVEEGIPESEITLLEEKWHNLITDQANLSNESELIFAQNASHSIYLDRPEVIINSINNLMLRIG